MSKQEELRYKVEQMFDTWFYNFAEAEPDETHTLVMHEVHDDGAGDAIKGEIEALINTQVVEALEEVEKEAFETVVGYGGISGTNQGITNIDSVVSLSAIQSIKAKYKVEEK